MQFPDPALARELGVVPWLLMVVVLFGVGMVGFFLRRMTAAMDRMAAAQEATPALVGKLETLFIERMERMEGKVDRAVELADEHVRIAHMWEQTEAPGRQIRQEGHGGR